MASAAYGEGGYCWLLFEAAGNSAPLCPPETPPAAGLGTRADYHSHLDLVEVGPDVVSLTCDAEPLVIVTDPALDNRRFVVTPCDDPS